MNVKKTVFVLATLAGLVQGLAEPKCDLRGGAAEADDAAICNGRVNGVRIETLSDGWTFRLEGETAERSVRVPHDWGIESGFLKAGACPAQGDLPFVGKGFYRRAFDGFTPPPGGRTYLTLDGVQCRSVVKLNGKTVSGRPFGYASETIDVTDALKDSGNVLEVEAENVPASSRWYPGSGIFRDVTVRVCPPDHVKPNTLFVRTIEANEKSARVAVSFEWRGGASNFVFSVENPRLWSPESPALYDLELFGEKFRYGIRTAVFDPQKGFFLNGVHRQMKGVCLHHDLGPIGAAFDRDFARRQLALLKEMGCDAIRTSHNPPAAALLDLCDEMGLMVMDEAFDMWEEWKGDYSVFWKDWHVRDLAEFVRRDRSHPSVVMWSMGNELLEHNDKTPERPIRIAAELNSIIKANDLTRPVTFGSWKSAPMWNGCQNTVDAFGANYLPFKYAEFSKRNPKVGLVATETSSCVSSRGEYFFPVVASPITGEGDLKRRRDEGRDNMVRGGQMSGYDLWGPHPNDYPPDVEFEHQERNPQVYGEFVWTGFDYLGEPDPCSKSGGRSSYFGIFDLAGIPKDRYWLYKSHWRPDEPTAHILPHWTWPGREGEVTPVHVYTSGDEAELFVNGVSQGRKRRGEYEYRFVWNDVRYEPGEVRVKTWRNGKEWAEDVVKTALEPVRVERSERRFGRITFVTFALKDKNGTVCPNADQVLAFETRPGTRLVSLCNGDATSREDFRGSSMHTFHGFLVAAVEGPAEGLVISPRVATQEWRPKERWCGFNLLGMFCQTKMAEGDKRIFGYFPEDRFQWMQEWGFNFARLPLDYRFFVEKDDWMKPVESQLAKLDDAVRYGKKYGIHVQINFHRAPGYCCNAPKEPKSLFHDPEPLAAFTNLWAVLARRYRGIPNEELSFDLVNEPAPVAAYGATGATPSNYAAVARMAIAAIRAVDQSRFVMSDGWRWGKEPVMELHPFGPATGESIHCYEPQLLTHYKVGNPNEKRPCPPWPLEGWTNGVEWLERFVVKLWQPAIDDGTFIHAGELGCHQGNVPHATYLAWLEDTLRMCDRHGWGWALWNLDGTFGILDTPRTDCEFEDFHGHKLDRKALDILRNHR